MNMHVPRILQIDAKLLDDEIISILKSQITEAFAFTSYRTLTLFEPEFDAILKFFLYHFTLGKLHLTPGQQLYQIKYDEKIPRLKLKYYYASLILGQWMKSRLSLSQDFIGNENLKLSISKFTDLLEVIYQMIDIFNLLGFIANGRYASMMERILKLRVIPMNPNSIRTICYSYFAKELLWDGMSKLLSVALPLFPANQIQNLFLKLIPSFLASSNHQNESEINSEEFYTHCVICDDVTILPHTFGCHHVACYYCIHSVFAIDSSFNCPKCQASVNCVTDIVPLKIKS